MKGPAVRQSVVYSFRKSVPVTIFWVSEVPAMKSFIFRSSR